MLIKIRKENSIFKEYQKIIYRDICRDKIKVKIPPKENQLTTFMKNIYASDITRNVEWTPQIQNK